MGETNFSTLPTAVYGFVLLMAALAGWILQRNILAQNENSPLATAKEKSEKEGDTLIIYAVGILLTFVQPWIGGALYALVALIWIIPDRRMERALARGRQQDETNG